MCVHIVNVYITLQTHLLSTHIVVLYTVRVDDIGYKIKIECVRVEYSLYSRIHVRYSREQCKISHVQTYEYSYSIQWHYP